jgi:hypothetical protein
MLDQGHFLGKQINFMVGVKLRGTASVSLLLQGSLQAGRKVWGSFINYLL